MLRVARSGSPKSRLDNRDIDALAANGHPLKKAVTEVVEDGIQQAAGVQVTASNGSEKRLTMTDIDGVFAIDGLPAGTWTLTLTKAGYADQSIELALANDADLALTPGQTYVYSVRGVDVYGQWSPLSRSSSRAPSMCSARKRPWPART